MRAFKTFFIVYICYSILSLGAVVVNVYTPDQIPQDTTTQSQLLTHIPFYLDSLYLDSLYLDSTQPDQLQLQLDEMDKLIYKKQNKIK